jgi:hypothetical protein
MDHINDAERLKLLREIDKRIAQSKRLRLQQLGYDGERLEKMFKTLFNRSLPHKYQRRRE